MMKLYGLNSLGRYLLGIALLAGLSACSDSSDTETANAGGREGESASEAQVTPPPMPEGAEPEGQVPAEEVAGPPPERDLRGAPTGANEEVALPTEASAREQSEVPAVVDPNTPVVPDESLSRNDPSASVNEGPDAPTAPPAPNLVPGSPDVATPDVPVREEETAASNARE